MYKPALAEAGIEYHVPAVGVTVPVIGAEVVVVAES
jgi:hypothetical protein